MSAGMVSLAIGVRARGRGPGAPGPSSPGSPPGSPPVLAAPPALAGLRDGAAGIGTEVALDPGAWGGSPAPTLAVRWHRDGQAVPGATGPVYRPGPDEDGGRLGAEVTARNAFGTARAATPTHRVAWPAPTAAGGLPDQILSQDRGTTTVSTAFDFSGGGLSFRVSGPGVSIDPATGLLSIDTRELQDGVEITVTATNSGGTATSRFRLTVAALPVSRAPVVTGALPDLSLLHGSAPRVVAAAAAFAGADLAFAVEGGGATVDAATGKVTLSAAALRPAEPVTVTARNADGSASAGFRVTVAPAVLPPAVAGSLPDLALPAGQGVRTVSAQGAFTGTGLGFSLAAAPAGVTVDPATGLLRVDTGPAESPTAEALVTLRAANAAGSAEAGFRLTRRTTASSFAAPAALSDLSFLGANAGQVALSHDPAGFARMVTPASGRVHGAWAHAGGDGRTRILARWTAPNPAGAPYSPFLLGSRVSVDAAGNWRGAVLEVLQPAGSPRRLRALAFTGSGSATSALAVAELAWEWGAWTWVEVEIAGGALRGRLYPEAAPAPDWQVVATLPATVPATGGATGPAALPQGGQSPTVDIRRIEFQPLPEAAPAAAAAANWTLAQINLQS